MDVLEIPPEIDYISTLPDDIVLHIISLLSKGETINQAATQLKVLSKHFYNICRSNPRLVFSYHIYEDIFGMDRERNRQISFSRIVDQTLREHDDSDVHTLVIYNYATGTIRRQWVLFGVEHNVRHLKLIGSMRRVPNTAFNSNTIVSLHLQSFDFIFRGFHDGIIIPNLEKLVFKYVKLGLENKKGMYPFGIGLHTCFPKLNEFLIYHCNFQHIHEFRCSHPSLKIFKMAFNYKQSEIPVVLDLPRVDILVVLVTEKQRKGPVVGTVLQHAPPSSSLLTLMVGERLVRFDNHMTEDQFSYEVAKMAKQLVYGVTVDDEPHFLSFALTKVCLNPS